MFVIEVFVRACIVLIKEFSKQTSNIPGSGNVHYGIIDSGMISSFHLIFFIYGNIYLSKSDPLKYTVI